jgi:hypothetical protein
MQEENLISNHKFFFWQIALSAGGTRHGMPGFKACRVSHSTIIQSGAGRKF